MNQIAIILYSNPKAPTKSGIPNNKKIVLECDKLEILEDIRHKLQYETDIYHLFSAGALIQVSQKTKTVFKYICDNLFKKYKTEEGKWKLNNYQFPKFNQEIL